MRLFILAIFLIFGSLKWEVNANCLEIAQNFKCTYMHLQCKDNDNGECSCEDGTICKWINRQGDENCPCGAKKQQPRRRRRRVDDGL